jgi:hypothetical protein
VEKGGLRAALGEQRLLYHWLSEMLHTAKPSPRSRISRSMARRRRTLACWSPNIANRGYFLQLVGDMLDHCWLSDDGPLVREF